MTEEVQFEYLVDDDLLKLSPSGAKKFGVETELLHPAEDLRLREQLGKTWFEGIIQFFRKTSPQDPEFRYECELPIGGELRWYRVIVRAIWSDDIEPRITSAIGKLMDVHELHNELASLKESSIRDPLTGLLNRNGVGEEIDRKLANYPAHKYAVTVFDIDFFKNANDTYGHLFGDRVLRVVADRLIHGTRAGDLCARIGGDEFLIVFEYDTDIHPIIARVFGAICGAVGDFALTVSMGICEKSSADEDYKGLFRKADIALYAAKKQGRSRYRFYDESMEDDAALKDADLPDSPKTVD